MSTISKTIAEDSTSKKKNLLKHGLETIKRGLNFVWKDLRKTHLIWVKVVFFLQSASLVTLYPYLVYYFLFSFAIILIKYLLSMFLKKLGLQFFLSFRQYISKLLGLPSKMPQQSTVSYQAQIFSAHLQQAFWQTNWVIFGFSWLS